MKHATGRKKHLMLLRHAKSSWEDSSLSDFDRPLNGRGRAAAKVMGAHLASAGHIPDLILCSSARRALETLGRIFPFVPGDREVKVLRSIYAAQSGEELLSIIQSAAGRAKSIMAIGHNPVMEDLARMLAGTDSNGRLGELTTKYPTCGLAVLEHTRAWRSLGTGDADLTEFTVPREL